MSKPPDATIVVFRKWRSRRDGYDIIALFPDIPESGGMCLSFEHTGQHGAADYSSVISRTYPAEPFEYAALKRELESAPYEYVLDVRQRAPRR
jgi:hypothetical protein